MVPLDCRAGIIGSQINHLAVVLDHDGATQRYNVRIHGAAHIGRYTPAAGCDAGACPTDVGPFLAAVEGV